VHGSDCFDYVPARPQTRRDQSTTGTLSTVDASSSAAQSGRKDPGQRHGVAVHHELHGGSDRSIGPWLRSGVRGCAGGCSGGALAPITEITSTP